MNANNSQVTTFNWKTEDFWDFCNSNWNKCNFSNHFELTNSPSIKFALFREDINWKLELTFGVALQSSGGHEAVCVKFKFWIEDHLGNKKREWTIEEHEFKDAGDKHAFTAERNAGEWQALYDAYYSKQSVSFCCEITLLAPVKYVQAQNDIYTFRQKLWAIYQEGLEKDITIKVGAREFMTNRAILSSQCEVFKSMLSSNFKEGITGKIEIKDFDVETVECFIKWLYLGVLDPENLVEKIFLVADKYLIQDLKKQCSELMASILSNENVVEHLILSIKYKSQELKETILEFISLESSANMLKFFTSDTWHNFEIEDKESADQAVNELRAKLQRSDIK